jgi:hypothetical protein
VSRPVGEADGAGRRTIQQLAALVGHYCWVEHRLFALTGAGAGARDR